MNIKLLVDRRFTTRMLPYLLWLSLALVGWPLLVFTLLEARRASRRCFLLLGSEDGVGPSASAFPTSALASTSAAPSPPVNEELSAVNVNPGCKEWYVILNDRETKQGASYRPLIRALGPCDRTYRAEVVRREVRGLMKP